MRVVWEKLVACLYGVTKHCIGGSDIVALTLSQGSFNMTHVRLRLVIGVILLSYTFGAYVYHVGLSIFYPISSSTSPLEGHESDFPPPAPVPQILPPHSLPNVWDKGVLFMVLLAFFPRIVLLVGTRMEFDLNSIIRWSLTPEMQVLHMARSNGYQHSNPIVFYCFAIYATFSGVYQLYGVFHKYITAPLPATATGEAPQLITLGQLTAINRGIALGFFSLKAKYTQLQQRLNMLEANPETIQSLNYPQLVNLRNILQEKLEAITEKVREKAPRGNMPDQTDIPDSCIACMASTPCVKFLPCSHVCFCLDCFNRYPNEFNG